MSYPYRYSTGRNPARLANRSSWGPMSAPVALNRPEPATTPEECVEKYQEHVLTSQNRQLYPLQEDLADWLNKTLDLEHITGENFFDVLDNGAILCRLGKVIQEKARKAFNTGTAKGPVPTIQPRYWESAARRSFFSRDNMENFIRFCRKLGVHENLLFESDDLVMHGQPRNVVLCLLEVARLATRYDVEPPGLVQFEKEIAEEESQDSGLSHSSILSWQFQAAQIDTPRNSCENKMRQSKSTSAISANINRWTEDHGCGIVLLSTEKPVVEHNHSSLTAVVPSGASDGVPSDTTEDDWSRGSGDDLEMDIDTRTVDLNPPATSPVVEHVSPVTELDRRVQHATNLMQKSCCCSNGKCSKLRVKKIGEGKYNIAGRNVFIRLLKGRHMMVRVGGGWDTLEHFLIRHDPCQVRSPSITSPDRPASASKYLHRNPPARELVMR